MLYLGKELDPATGRDAGRRLEYDPDNLTTHAVCFGMTGSGKTGLCIVLMEEVIRSGVPVFLIDPKGDLTNLLLTFPGLTAAEFEPWVDPEQARAAGQPVPRFAESAAARWREGLAASGLGPADVKALRDAAEFRLWTPGSTAGAPLNILGGFAPPPGADWDADPEPLRSRIAGTVGALLNLVDLDADPVKSPEGIFLAKLFELRWRAGQPLALEGIIRELQDPGEPMRTLGAMDTETLLPRARRMQVAMALNGLLAAPSFSAWTQGEPLDIARMIRAGEGGRPRANVLYIAHLSDRERMFFVAAFLQALISWLRAQPGTSSLRALFYMDEIFGYFPPLGNPPSKDPLLTLLKQARAFGVGAVLATQNPVDVDYKGLANAGTWFLGRLQTEQDRARLLDGLAGAGADRAAVERSLAALPPRSFLLHDGHAPGLRMFSTRWAMSYLRGPMTREEVKRLRLATAAAASAPTPAAVAPAPAAAPAPASGEGRAVREPAPAGVPEWFAPDSGAALLVPALRARARVVFEDAAAGIHDVREEDLALPLDAGDQPGGLRWDQAGPIAGVVAGEPAAQPPPGARFGDLPDAFRAAAAYRTAAAGLKGHLAATRALASLRNPGLKLASRPGESRESFLQRCRDEAARRQEDEKLALKAKYEEKIRRMQARTEKEQRELEQDKQVLAGRKVDELVNAGETLLGMFLGGRRRSIAGMSGRRRMVSTSSARVEKSEAEYRAAVEELERMQQEAESALQEMEARWQAAAGAIVETPVRPGKSGIEVAQLGLIWIRK